MQNKLQELTDKLYNEGLSKGKQEGEEILAKAKVQAEEIVAKAKAEAAAIVAAANKDAEDLKTKVVRGLRVNAEKCKWNGGVLPIGYKVDEEKNILLNMKIGSGVVSGVNLGTNSTSYNWEAGKKYVYTMTLTTERITFDVHVREWIDDEIEL